MVIYHFPLKRIKHINPLLNESDFVMLPKNMACEIFTSDSSMYCIKIINGDKTVYGRFHEVSSDNNAYAPDWMINQLDYKDGDVRLENIEVCEGKLIHFKCSHELPDPTKVLEHRLMDHKVYYVGKKIIERVSDTVTVSFEIVKTDNGNRPIRVMDEISYDIDYD